MLPVIEALLAGAAVGIINRFLARLEHECPDSTSTGLPSAWFESNVQFCFQQHVLFLCACRSHFDDDACLQLLHSCSLLLLLLRLLGRKLFQSEPACTGTTRENIMLASTARCVGSPSQ
jgi:hypothetical protein